MLNRLKNSIFEFPQQRTPTPQRWLPPQPASLDKLLANRKINDFEKWVHSQSAEDLSQWIYEGKGANSINTSAEAWKNLAHALNVLTNAHSDVISRLFTESWTGTSAKIMAAASISFIVWVKTMAHAAGATYHYAREAEKAFEQARAGHVPPILIHANRVQFRALNSNVFGQKTEALITVQEKYRKMRQQNIDAMCGYFQKMNNETHILMKFARFTKVPKISEFNADQYLAQAKTQLTGFYDQAKQEAPQRDEQGCQVEPSDTRVYEDSSDDE